MKKETAPTNDEGQEGDVIVQKANNTPQIKKDALRLYKIVHYLSMTNLEIESINRSNINPIIYNTIGSVYNRNKRMIKELKEKTKDFDSIFDSLSNEKIYAMMSVMNKMMLLSEQQAVEFESFLELKEQ
jgi:flagellar capping protein FliD